LEFAPHPAAELAAAAMGHPTDSLFDVLERSRLALGTRGLILWEGDAQTFQFSYVSPSAEGILGYPVERWTTEPKFWTETVVHPDDRDDAVAFCALATGKKCDHDFEYRAIRSDGSIIWLYDIVQVIVNERDVPTMLRGIMLDVSDRHEGESDSA
jgi:PAS domain S-box-containing protein